MDEKKIVTMVDDWNKKLPVLPPNAKDTLVQILPWLALIFGILGVIGSISALGIVSVFAPLAMLGGGVRASGAAFIVVLLHLVASILLLLAFPGLRRQQYAGWRWSFWSTVLDIVSSVVTLSLGGLLINLIVLYLLFQVRARYK